MAGEEPQPARFRQALNHPGFSVKVDDRIALFPRTVRTLVAATREATVQEASLGHGGGKARCMLAEDLRWSGPESWLLVNGVYRLILQRARPAATYDRTRLDLAQTQTKPVKQREVR